MTCGKLSRRVNAPKQRVPQTAEVRVLGVVDLGDTPRVDACTNRLAVNHDLLFRADDREGEQGLEARGQLMGRVPRRGTYAKLAVLLDGLLVVLFDVVREVVDGDVVVLDVLHNLVHVSTSKALCFKERCVPAS